MDRIEALKVLYMVLDTEMELLLLEMEQDRKEQKRIEQESEVSADA